MGMRKARQLVVGVSLLVLLVLASVAVAAARQGRSKRHDRPSGRDTLLVTSNSDGPNAATTPGTLRWAITTNNSLAPAQRAADPRTIEVEPTAGIVAITSELPSLLGPVTIVGAGDEWTRPTVGVTGTAFQNPYAPGGSFCPSTDGNIPATVIGTTTTPEAGNGPNVRGVFDPLLQVANPTVTGTSPTTYGTADGTAYGTPNGAFGVPADYNGAEPNGHVTIDHLVLENACIGILSLRSHDNTFEHNLIYNDVGAAGVIVTGDAGDASGSGTTGVSVNNTTEYNRFVDNGDDMEYTRGTSDGLIKDNVYIEDPEPLGTAATGADTGATDTTGTPGLLQAGDLPSQTIEFAGSNDNNNTVIGNHLLGGMSDGFQNGGTGMVFKDNYITGDAYAVDLDASGAVYEDNVITGNHAGMESRGAPTNDTILDNSIYGQGAPISICNAGGVCISNASYSAGILGIGSSAGSSAEPGCAGGAQNYPVLTGATTTPNGSVEVAGTLSCTANGSFEIQLFGNHVRSTSGFGEGEFLVGSTTATTDASGNAQFSVRIPSYQARYLNWNTPFLSATATNDATGATSQFSADFTLSL
jgi:hypothetical protein